MTTSLADGTMADKLAQFDLLKEIDDAERKKPWSSGHYARTLFKTHDLRVVLFTMQDASRMKEHHADGALSIQVLKGKLRVSVDGESHTLGVGNLLALAASLRHDVESVGDSAFLLTLSWPRAQELAAMQHRGYGS
jgi:quercetin dioxygenase-like cupin family protein